jgi:tetratricopeptide (TPR) repeat protein
MTARQTFGHPKWTASARTCAKAVTLVAIVCLASGCGGNATAPPISATVTPKKAAPLSSGPMILRAHGAGKEHSPMTFGVLMREVSRQAVLVAARDGLGRTTRDALLREPMESDDGTGAVDIVIQYNSEGPSVLEFEGRRKGGGGWLCRQEFAVDLKRDVDYSNRWAKLISDAESFSRAKFADSLKEVYQVDANRVVEDGPVEAEAERLLSEMDYISQFSAARRLHAQVRSDGESVPRLAALARAYAQLGSLSESHFSPTHKVFKARALLYAERLVATHPDLAWPLWQRAFVRATVGLHKLALDDIQAAEKLGGNDRPPPWLELIDAYCHFDLKRLDAAGQDAALAQLAALLRLYTAESSTIISRILAAAQALLEKSPACDRGVDAICNTGELGTKRLGAFLGGRLVLAELTARLNALSDLPESVQGVLRIPEQGVIEDNEVAVAMSGIDLQPAPRAVQLLREAAKDDVGEPSWAVLATLLEDAHFGQSWRELELEQFLGMPLAESLARWKTFAGDHPLKEALAEQAPASMSRGTVSVGSHMQDKLQSVPEPMRKFDFEMREEHLLGHAKPFGEQTSSVFSRAMANADMVYPDLVLLRTIEGRRQSNYRDSSTASALMNISPLSPQATAAAITDSEWDLVADKVAAWDKQFADDASVQYALGGRYKALERYDDAERCLKRAVALAPEKRHYEELAAVYAKRGDTQQWQATLDEFLKQPSYGLEDDDIRVRLSNHFAARHEWQKALEYAEQAAESNAAWAMLAAARSYEALQRWPQAEEGYRVTSLSYSDERFDWYAFCVRTGKGDIGAARELAEGYVNDLVTRAHGDDLWPVMAFHLLEGRTGPALEVIKEMIDQKMNPFFAILGALMADELNDAETRDSLLKKAAIHIVDDPTVDNSQPRREFIYLAEAFARDIAEGGKGDLEFENLDQLLGKAGPNQRLASQYLVGYYLDLRGKPEQATDYLKRAMVSNPYWVIRTYPGQRLLARGIGPEQYGEALLQPAKVN